MSILDLNADVLPFLNLTADDSYGNAARMQAVCEQFFKTYCGRNFEQTSMKEVIRNNPNASVFLKEYPVQSISKVSAYRVSCFSVSNSNNDTTALVSVDVNGVNLSYNYNTVATLKFSQYATLASMAAAVAAAGSGFSATVNAGYENYLSSELVPQMAIECIGGAQASLYMPVIALSGYQCDEITGELTTTGTVEDDFGATDYVYPAVDMMLTRQPLKVPFWWWMQHPGIIYVNYVGGFTRASGLTVNVTAAAGIVTAVALGNSGGLNYSVGQVVTITSGLGGTVVVNSVDAFGTVTALSLASGGTSGYTTGNNQTTVSLCNAPADLKLGILAMIQQMYMKCNEGTFGVDMYRIEGLQKTVKEFPDETQAALALYKRFRV